jgi:hypothetical protein
MYVVAGITGQVGSVVAGSLLAAAFLSAQSSAVTRKERLGRRRGVRSQSRRSWIPMRWPRRSTAGRVFS